MPAATITDRQRRANTEAWRHEGYEQWERQQMEDPRFASVRMLCDDIRNHGEILAETWQRFDTEESTWAAEILDAPQVHVDRFTFDGHDIIVKETDGIQPRITLRSIYENGLEQTKREVEQEPGLVFQQKRDELFMHYLEAIEDMMRGNTPHDTISMRSTCPIPEEIADDPHEAERLLQLHHYNLKRAMSFDYTARRLPNGELELSVTTYDNSNLKAHQAVLKSDGYADVDFGGYTSHEYGLFLGFANTTDRPIQVVIAERAALYDQEMQRQTGQPHRYGRLDETIDAHEFLNTHCEDYRIGYKAYHELLARHLEGEPISEHLQNYLLRCIDSQEATGKTVLSGRAALDRLKTQVRFGKITRDMAMSCRELLVYDHHATVTNLLNQYKETGTVDSLQWQSSGDFLDAYANDASNNGAEAAARGETFDGCETGTGVQSLEQAAQIAQEQGISLEEVLRRAQAEREWKKGDCRVCLKTDIKVGECLVCKDCEDAHNKGGDKALDSIAHQALERFEAELRGEIMTSRSPELSRRKLQHGGLYRFGHNLLEYRVELLVGGAVPTFITNDGYIITGEDAEAVLQTLEQITQSSVAPTT